MTSENNKHRVDKAWDLFYSQFSDFLGEFEKETDRAAVILGTARLDIALYNLLAAALVPSPTSRDDLFDPEMPLSSLSAKIDMAHRLALIDAQFARALHIVRRIRNAFAHEAVGVTLASGAQSNRVRELMLPFHRSKNFAEFCEAFSNRFKGPAGDFRLALGIMVIRLERAAERTSEPRAGHALTLLSPDDAAPSTAGSPGGEPAPQGG